MKKLALVIPFFILLCFTFGCRKSEEVTDEPAVDVAAEMEAVREAFWVQANAARAKDVELLVVNLGR